MRVAVCDDERIILEEIREMLNGIELVTQVRLFSDIDGFLTVLQSGEYYDAVLMDIVWEQSENGIDFASKVQEISPTTKVVYITGYVKEFVEDIFLNASNLSGFLMKPVKFDALQKNIEKIAEDMERGEEKLVVKYQGTLLAIHFSDILYIENQLHRVEIISEQKSYFASENLARVKERLGGQFLTCHKSFVVNMDKILEFGNKGILLKSGMVIPVSKAYYKAAKESYFYYVSDRM